MSDVLLEVKDLVVGFKSSKGINTVINNVNLKIEKGKVLGLVGESGCGKSITSLSVIGLLPEPNGVVENGEINFEGINLLKLPENKMETIRGNDIAMIFQEPMTALNPVFTIGFQIGEALSIHQKLTGKKNRDRCIQLLKMVGIPRPDKLIDEYPHQLSGGMRQRVMIAMALSCNPRLLIADEPTTALDVTIQAQVIELMKDLQLKYNTALLFITHDLGVIAEVADEVAVMYLGRVVEEAEVVDIFDEPLHPYTKGLLNSRPENIKKGHKLKCIKGMVPNATDNIKGCAFYDRCGSAMDICNKKMPDLVEVKKGHKVRCWLYEKEVNENGRKIN